MERMHRCSNVCLTIPIFIKCKILSCHFLTHRLFNCCLIFQFLVSLFPMHFPFNNRFIFSSFYLFSRSIFKDAKKYAEELNIECDFDDGETILRNGNKEMRVSGKEPHNVNSIINKGNTDRHMRDTQKTALGWEICDSTLELSSNIK